MPKLYYCSKNNYDYCKRLFSFSVFKAERQSLSSEDLNFLRPERFFSFLSLIFLGLDIVWSSPLHSAATSLTVQENRHYKKRILTNTLCITCQTLTNVSGCSHFNPANEVNLEEGLDRQWWVVWIQFQGKPSNNISYASKRKPTWGAFW